MTSRHPSGYPVAHDAPAFVAPPLELRRAVEATSEGAVEDAVAFTLAFPIVERVRASVPSPDFEQTAHHAVIIEDQGESESTSPDFAPPPLGAEPEVDTAVDLPRVDPESTLQGDPYKESGETTLHASESDTLRQQLLSIGQFDGAADLGNERSSSARVMLGRARAIRFRLALLSVWPEDFSPASPPEDDLDLLLHPAIVAALADGAPRSTADSELARALVVATRSRLPHTSRNTLREAGAAAFARVTLLGTQRAVAYLHDRFHEWPAEARRNALALAAKVVAGRAASDPGVLTLRMLDDALG